MFISESNELNLQVTFDMVNGEPINAHCLENSLWRRPWEPQFTQTSPTIKPEREIKKTQHSSNKERSLLSGPPSWLTASTKRSWELLSPSQAFLGRTIGATWTMHCGDNGSIALGDKVQL
ncbi:hypothetical protein V6N13_060162 [Hibiscus sabdariffa]